MNSVRFKFMTIVLVIVLFIGFGLLKAEAADYFPLEVGNRWIYSPSYGAHGYRIDTILKEESINGTNTYVWNRQEAPDDNYNEKRWIAKDGSDLKVYKIWGDEGLDPAIIITPPWIQDKLNPAVGDTWVTDLANDNLQVKVTSYVESRNETVTVPAGTFNNCIRVRDLYEITENSSTEFDYEKHWLAPDVGPIMYRDYTDNWVSVGFSQELLSFTNINSSFPGPEIKLPQVRSFHNADGSIGTEFIARITGPSPEDVVSFTATGPSGTFNLVPHRSSRQLGLFYMHSESSILSDGSYTFEVTDSQARTASVVKNFTYDSTIPQVDSSTMSPQNEAYVGTTTPTLSFDPVSGGSVYYQVLVWDYENKALWFVSSRTQDTSFPVPDGLLQPNTPYLWAVRVYDSDTDPQNYHQSERLCFYIGTKGVPDLSERWVLSFDTPEYSANWFAVRNLNVAPWDINYLKVTGPDSTVYSLDWIDYRFYCPAFYCIRSTSPFPMPDGTYTFEIEDDESNTVTETSSYTYNPVPAVSDNSMVPADNAYLDTNTPTFSWDPVEGNGTYYYSVRICDYNSNIKWYQFPLSTGTSVTIPESVNLSSGSSYKWQVLVFDSDTLINNVSFSSQRTFTISESSSIETGYLVTSDLWIRAVINTVEKGPIEAIWHKGGEDVTSRGDRVIWGHFYASPSNVTWGSQDNPDLFVKIWFDVSGRVDVNYFHVSVPDIDVYSDYPYDGTPDEQGTTTMDRRYIRQYYQNGQSYSDENYEDGYPPAGYSLTGNPSGYLTINDLRIGSTINTVEKGSIDALWRLGGQDATSRGDQVVWGHFYASPTDVTWGSQNNPDLFVKIWFDHGGRVDVNFFHVSVPDIEVYSDLPDDGNYDNQGTTIMSNRYIRHEYWR